jgi:cell division protein FtsN
MGKIDSSYAWLRQTIAKFPGSDIADPARKELGALPISGDTETVILEPAKPGESIQYFCQTGAFSRQDNALLRKSFFESKGFSVHFRSKIKDGQTLYLVWIGPLETLEQARVMAESLKKKYGISCTVVTDTS